MDDFSLFGIAGLSNQGLHALRASTAMDFRRIGRPNKP